MTDDEILERAREIASETGVSLTDAMIRAEAELAPKPEIQKEFTVTLDLKPRVARWVLTEFQAYGGHSVEDRLAAYLVTVLNRARTTSMRAAEDAPEVGRGGAVTVPRHKFKEDAA